MINKSQQMSVMFFFNFGVLGDNNKASDFAFELNKKRPELNYVVMIDWKQHKEECTGRMFFFKSFQEMLTMQSMGKKKICFIFKGTEEEKMELIAKDSTATNTFASGVKWEII